MNTCMTCRRPTPQTQGDPTHGYCPTCGSTLGRTLDDGSPVEAWSLTSFSVELETQPGWGASAAEARAARRAERDQGLLRGLLGL